jgi:hypothetical protein
MITLLPLFVGDQLLCLGRTTTLTEAGSAQLR